MQFNSEILKKITILNNLLKQKKLNINLNFKGIGYHSNDHWPVDKFGEYLDPQNDLKNMIPIDGRGRRRVITINDKFTGPTLRVRAGAVIKVVVRNELVRTTTN